MIASVPRQGNRHCKTKETCGHPCGDKAKMTLLPFTHQVVGRLNVPVACEAIREDWGPGGDLLGAERVEGIRKSEEKYKKC